jgi:hypothetical protein
MLNQKNPFGTLFFITERGFQAYRGAEHSRMLWVSILKEIKPIYAFIAGVASTLVMDYLKRKLHWQVRRFTCFLKILFTMVSSLFKTFQSTGTWLVERLDGSLFCWFIFF